MATIPIPGSELRHVRKTITFTGGAGAGAVGTATIFTITGTVELRSLYARASSDLTSAGDPSLDIGTASVGFGSQVTNLGTTTPVAAGSWVNDPSTQGYNLVDNYGGSGGKLATAENIVAHIGTAAISGGTIVVDCWYRPITDDGALAGDDIDQDSRTWTWATALSDIAAVPAITASALSGLNWLFALARNKRTQTATTETVYKDDGSTSLATSTKSDDGTTFTRGEYS